MSPFCINAITLSFGFNWFICVFPPFVLTIAFPPDPNMFAKSSHTSLLFLNSTSSKLEELPVSKNLAKSITSSTLSSISLTFNNCDFDILALSKNSFKRSFSCFEPLFSKALTTYWSCPPNLANSSSLSFNPNISFSYPSIWDAIDLIVEALPFNFCCDASCLPFCIFEVYSDVNQFKTGTDFIKASPAIEAKSTTRPSIFSLTHLKSLIKGPLSPINTSMSLLNVSCIAIESSLFKPKISINIVVIELSPWSLL